MRCHACHDRYHCVLANGMEWSGVEWGVCDIVCRWQCHNFSEQLEFKLENGLSVF